MSKRVVIMRGPSGSGKSTWLEKNAPDAHVVSADQYFMKRCGFSVSDKAVLIGGVYYEYVFDPARIALAHAWCMGEFLKALKEGRPLVAVDNTNTHIREFENYVHAAELAGYEVQVVVMRAITVDDIKLCAERNAHRVPIEVVAKMAYEYEPYEGEVRPSSPYTQEEPAPSINRYLPNEDKPRQERKSGLSRLSH